MRTGLQLIACLSAWFLLTGVCMAQQGVMQSRAHSTQTGELTLLTETQVTDVRPYVEDVLHRIADSWHKLVPEGQARDYFRKTKVNIIFVIWRDGTVHMMRFDPASDDIKLDTSCWKAIKQASPFPALPQDFKGKLIAVKFRLTYVPPKTD